MSKKKVKIKDITKCTGCMYYNIMYKKCNLDKENCIYKNKK